MAGLDDLYAQIPTSQIATKLGVEENEVDSAVHALVPVLLSGLQQNSRDPGEADRIKAVATDHAARGLLDAGGGVDRVDESDGQQAISTLFGGNDPNQLASALAKSGAGNSDMLKQLLPVLVPLVLAYIGKQLSAAPQGKSPQNEAASGGLGEVLGSILGGASDDKSLGGLLGKVLSGKGGVLGDVLGGLLGGTK